MRTTSLHCTLLAAILFYTPSSAGAAILTTATAGPDEQTGTTSASASSDYLDELFDYSATASVSAGYVNASASTWASVYNRGVCPDCGGGNLAMATATVTDSLLLAVPTGGGYLRFNYEYIVSADFEASNASIGFLGQTHHASRGGYGEQFVNFTNLTPVPINLSMTVGSFPISYVPGAMSQSAFAQFTLTSIEVFDNANNPLSGILYSSASGAAYPISDAIQTPEPATLLITGTGLALLALRRPRIMR